MRHRLLDNESLDPVRMRQGHAKTHRATVILQVKRATGEPERFGKVNHDFGVVIEGVRKLFRVRPVAVSEARVIGRDKIIRAGGISKCTGLYRQAPHVINVRPSLSCQPESSVERSRPEHEWHPGLPRRCASRAGEWRFASGLGSLDQGRAVRTMRSASCRASFRLEQRRFSWAVWVNTVSTQSVALWLWMKNAPFLCTDINLLSVKRCHPRRGGVVVVMACD